MELDTYDRQLLNLVQVDAGRTADELAEHVGLSPSAIQRRLRRLRDEGVIQRDIAVAAPDLVGKPTFFVVALQVERERPEMLHALRKWLAEQAQIQQAYYITGEADFTLIVTASDTEAFDRFMIRLMAENGNVKRFTTNVVLSLVKRELAIPLPER
jgi:Lrp/AsnC family leucine-responsive transcriptional regulator